MGKVTLPRRALTNYDLIYFAKKYRIPHFRGVFMRNRLPKKPWKQECGIMNLEPQSRRGSHWVAYIKKNRNAVYFDSFGDLPPPRELVRYLKKCSMTYNYETFQSYNSVRCGHLCLKFLLQHV